jgi:hypothetical protein
MGNEYHSVGTEITAEKYIDTTVKKVKFVNERMST